MEGSFLAPGPPKLTFGESIGYQFLFILPIGQDSVFQKILTSPISLMNIFLGHPVYDESIIRKYIFDLKLMFTKKRNNEVVKHL